MKELWKILRTTQFITTGYFTKIPVNYVFKDNNRKLFFDHLHRIKGDDVQSALWLDHLKNVNYYCDTQDVALLDTELDGLKKSYNSHTDTTVHEVIDSEKAIFEKNANSFPEDSLNYDLRKFRPNPCFLPNGNIKLRKRD